MPMSPEEYLAAEIHRYFPDAQDVVVGFTDEETIDATVRFHGNDPIMLHMEIGSDDDRYSFTSNFGHVLTVPLQPEEPEGPQTARNANVTLAIDIDAYSPLAKDATVDVSEHLVELLREHCGLYDVVEQSSEKLIVSLNLEGTFQVIEP